jgi:hypothetical protein
MPRYAQEKLCHATDLFTVGLLGEKRRVRTWEGVEADEWTYRQTDRWRQSPEGREGAGAEKVRKGKRGNTWKQRKNCGDWQPFYRKPALCCGR